MMNIRFYLGQRRLQVGGYICVSQQGFEFWNEAGFRGNMQDADALSEYARLLEI